MSISQVSLRVIFISMITCLCCTCCAGNLSEFSNVTAGTNNATYLVCCIPALAILFFFSLLTFRALSIIPPQLSQNVTSWESLNKHDCLLYGGELVGETCGYVPDITLMSFILFFGTYACSMALKQFKTSRFFPTTVSGAALRCPALQLNQRAALVCNELDNSEPSDDHMTFSPHYDAGASLA